MPTGRFLTAIIPVYQIMFVISVAIDNNGNKWFGTGGAGGGVAKFDNTNWTVYTGTNSGLPYDYVLSIAIDASGKKWFGTEGGKE